MTYIKKGTSRILIQNYRYDIAFNIVTKIILFINSIITVRVLGLGRFGNLAFLGSIPLLMSILITQANAAVLSRFIPEYKERNPHLIQVCVNRAIVHNLIYSIIIITTMFLALKGHILGFFNLKDVSTATMIIILANTFFMVMEEPVLTFLRVNYDNLFINLAILTQNLLTIAGFYTLFFAGLISITNLLLLAAVAQLVRFLLCALRYRKLNPTDHSLNMPEDEIKELRRYSRKMFLYSLLNFLTSQRGAIFFIQLYLGSTSVGLFRIMQRLTDSVKELLMPRSLNTLSTSSAIERFSSAGKKGLNEFMQKYISLNWICSIIIVLLLLSNIEWILGLFSVDYLENHPFVALYLIFSFSAFIASGFRKYMVVHKKNEWFTYTRIIGFSVLVFLMPLYLEHGLWVIALALTSIGCIEIFIYCLVIQKINASFLPRNFTAINLLVFSAGFILFYCLSLHGTNWLILNLLLLVIGGAYFIFFMSKEVKNLLKSICGFSTDIEQENVS